MPEISKECYAAVRKLLEDSKTFHGQLVRSPMWELIKKEPVIVSWMNSLNEVERNIQPPSPEEANLYGSKS